MDKKSRKVKTNTIKDQMKEIIFKILIRSLALVSVISCFLNFVTVNYTLRECMHEMAFTAANEIGYKIKNFTNPVEVIGSIARLTSQEQTPQEKQELLDSYKEHYNWELIHITDESGSIIGKSVYVGDRDYFKKSIKGDVTITEPFYSDEVDKFVVVVSAPLWKEGKINTEISGIVFAAVDAYEFRDLVAGIKISKNGTAYIIDASGNTIAHENFELVETSSNTIEEAKMDSKLKSLAKLEQNMIEQKDGFGSYTYNGVTKYMAYAPIGMNGWSIAVTAPVNDFIGSVILSMVAILFILILTGYISTKVASKYGDKIGGAIHACAERLKLLSEGDLETAVPIIDAEDETKILAESTATIVKTQHSIIGDAKHLLKEMSMGNFCVKSKIGVDAYVGEYKELLDAMRELRNDMVKILWSIVEVSQQVDAGAEQLASASQDLAEGSTGQTESVEELMNTVTLVTEQVEINKLAADEAHKKVQNLGKEADLSNKKMSELTLEMKNIEENSAKISNIIAEIEDIASQTNLLSLNASIEAARAGEAGKGFAVVADQIGKLAEQSAKSAVNTKHLIETSIREINKGSSVTAETAAHMESMIVELNSMIEVIEKVKVASESQTESIILIKSEVKEINDVAQSNSAAAEETSATSEELSAQAQTMDELVERFQLPDSLT